MKLVLINKLVKLGFGHTPVLCRRLDSIHSAKPRFNIMSDMLLGGEGCECKRFIGFSFTGAAFNNKNVFSARLAL